MPTEEQIKQIEEYLQKSHYRRRKDGKIIEGHDWIKFPPQIQEAVLCTKCNDIITKLLGGHYTYIYSSGMWRNRELAIGACERMMLEGKSLEEIAEEVEMTPRQVANMATKIHKRKREWDKLKDLKIKKKYIKP